LWFEKLLLIWAKPTTSGPTFVLAAAGASDIFYVLVVATAGKMATSRIEILRESNRKSQNRKAMIASTNKGYGRIPADSSGF
jgi:hypothetical protein